MTIWWTATVVGAASFSRAEQSVQKLTYCMQKCAIKWFNVQSCDALSAHWLATGHMISNNRYQKQSYYEYKLES